MRAGSRFLIGDDAELVTRLRACIGQTTAPQFHAQAIR
jgi:hypothetical protein